MPTVKEETIVFVLIDISQFDSVKCASEVLIWQKDALVDFKAALAGTKESFGRIVGGSPKKDVICLSFVVPLSMEDAKNHDMVRRAKGLYPGCKIGYEEKRPYNSKE